MASAMGGMRSPLTIRVYRQCLTGQRVPLWEGVGGVWHLMSAPAPHQALETSVVARYCRSMTALLTICKGCTLTRPYAILNRVLTWLRYAGSW